MRKTLVFVIVSLFFVGCSSPEQAQQPTALPVAATPVAIASGTTAEPTFVPSPTVEPTLAPSPTAEPTVALTVAPTVAPTEVPQPTASPYGEYEQFTIEALRSRSYGDGTIEIVRTLSETPEFTRQLFAYTSDGLRITGQLTQPKGQGPFPVIVLAHGYSPLATYTPGYDTQHASDYLAERGYLCLAPDFRSHYQSDKAPNLFRAGHVIDALNLLPLISRLPDAKPGKIGMWGHSNGGEITSKAMLVSDQIGAALIYAPASPFLPDNYNAFHANQQLGNPSNIADFPLTPEQAPDLYEQMSPVNYLQYTQAPVHIHYGTADVSVPRDWVDKLYNGLQAAGKQPEIFIYDGGAHSLRGRDKQVYLERTADFFDTYIRSQ